MTGRPSGLERVAELEDLRARLAEAEAVLRAIRSGDVDAVVVSGERGEQVYTLSGADRVYRQLIETMSEGAVTLSADGVIHYANQTFVRLLQTPLERVIGAEFRTFVSPAAEPVFADLLEATRGGSTWGEVSVRAADGSAVPLRLGFSRLQFDQETLVCVVATDLTEAKKKEEELGRLHADLEKRVEERTADLAASRLAALNMMEDAVEARQVAEASNRGLQQEMAERERAEALLRESEAELRAIFDGALDGILVSDAETRKFLTANSALCSMLGYTEEEIVRIGVSDIYPKQDLLRVIEQFERLLRCEIQLAMDIPLARKDGSVFYADVKASRIRVGGKDCLLGIFRDITERKAAERTIVHLNRVYAVLSGINALIVRVREREELFREACRIAVGEGGFPMALIAIVDRSAMKIVAAASAGKDEALLTVAKGILSSSEGTSTTMTARAIKEKKAVVSNDSQSDPQILFGKKYAEFGVRSVAVLPLIVSDEAVGALALYANESEFFLEEEMKLLTELSSDIAFAIDHIEKRERLDYLAYYDALTGLANRTLFLERVAQYIRSAVSGGHKLAVGLIDLERFKNINDSLGRPAGDALLRQVAEWLTRNARDVNLVARVGADHFAVLLPEVNQAGNITRLLEKMINAFMDHPFRLNDAVFRIAAKGGGALFPDDGADAETLFKNAEAALKMAKISGDRYLFHTQEMTKAVAGKLTLENQLRQALDQGEFVLHYQPKVNLASGKLTGAEALIRWNDPRTGLVPPGRFIPILEETGLIYDVGRWALRQAIADYLRWRAAGLPVVRIAVNVSPLQLRNRGFIDEIGQVISIDAHAAAGLELEITESLIMENVKHNIASLQAIRALGVTIAIDDFGTGFSSLSYLAKLPVDALKIDRSFVIDMTAGPEGLALVSTIINLAHSLKLKVVAEGVETEEQSRLLRLLSCDEMQGFLFSKAVPTEIFETRFLIPPASG